MCLYTFPACPANGYIISHFRDQRLEFGQGYDLGDVIQFGIATGEGCPAAVTQFRTCFDNLVRIGHQFKCVAVMSRRPQESIDTRPWLERLDRIMAENLSKLNEKFTTFKNGLLKCRDYIFSFLKNLAIPPDNNASERGIRKLKIKLKNSGCFRSDLGADTFMDLHSIVETTKKHGNSPYNAILALF